MSRLRALKSFATRSHTIVIGVAVTVLGGLVLAYSQQISGVGQSTPSVSAPHLEVDQVTLAYGSVPRAMAANPYGLARAAHPRPLLPDRCKAR